MSEPTRTAAFARDASYEQLLQGLNATLADVELPGTAPTRPIVLVLGLPRSGTTVLYQLLAQTGAFTYPSNLVARFYRAPAMGVLLQRLAAPLLDEPRWELASRGGLTDGWYQPHEFGYFWRHHLGIHEHHEPETPDLADLVLQLGRMEAAGTGPLLMKNALLVYSIPLLQRVLPTLTVIRIRRDPVDVAASILKMRTRYYGDPATWWSLRPRDVSPVEGASPEAQIAFQIHHGSKALSALDPAIDLTYEQLCGDVHHWVGRIADQARIQADLRGLPTTLDCRGTDDRERWATLL